MRRWLQGRAGRSGRISTPMQVGEAVELTTPTLGTQLLWQA